MGNRVLIVLSCKNKGKGRLFLIIFCRFGIIP